MSLYLVSSVQKFIFFFFKKNQNMIDITGYLAVHFTVMKMCTLFFFFFKQLIINSHIQISRSLGMSQKNKNVKNK